MTNEEFMFQAPEAGYLPKYVIQQPAAKPKEGRSRGTQKVKFYLKTPDNKYAAVESQVVQYEGPEAGLSAISYFNPSGSRNLEVSPDKRVDPRSHKFPERGEPVKSRMEKAAAEQAGKR